MYPTYCSDTPHCHIGRGGLCTKGKGCKAEAAGLEKVMGVSCTYRMMVHSEWMLQP